MKNSNLSNYTKASDLYGKTLSVNVYCRSHNGWLHSTTFNIGLSSSQCTLSIVGLNAPNVASIAKDYKGLRFLDDYNIELYSSVANANDNSVADQKVITVQFKVNKK